MLKCELDEHHGIAILEPNGELSKEDFQSVSKRIDSYLEKNNALNGLVIHVQSFPGWESFSSLVAHLKFVKEHHRAIPRIAFSTDSPVGNIAEKIAPHFVLADIKAYAFSDIEKAKKWAAGGVV